MTDARKVVSEKWKMVIRYPIKGNIGQILFALIPNFM